MLRLPIFLSIILLASSFILNDDTDELNREQETEKDGVIVAAAPRKSEGACSDEQLRKLMHQVRTPSFYGLLSPFRVCRIVPRNPKKACLLP